MWVTSSTANILKPNSIALGNFDGIHRGHQQVLQPILAKGERDSNYSTVVTFNPHPQEFFSGQSRKLLTPLAEKIRQLEFLGIDRLVLLPFDRELASLSPQQFVAEILVKQLEAKRISVGEDFRFGCDRAGTAADLRAIAAQFGTEVTIAHLENCQGERISSSAIRQALAQGDLSKANRLLGRSYSLTGKVVTGQQLGRTIGFPTANLQLPAAKFLPRYGVYSVGVFFEPQPLETEIEAILATSEQILVPQRSVTIPAAVDFGIRGVMNVGTRPTVEGTTTSVEVHLLDWSGDLYGKTLTVSLDNFLRSEQKFPSLEALKTQIALDCQAARQTKQSSV